MAYEAGTFRDVVPGVFVVGGPDLTDPQDCLVYAVDGGSEVALVDCGAGRSVEKILQNLDAAGLGGKPLTRVILTHCHVDHVGGLETLLALRAPRITIHEADAMAVEVGDPKATGASWYGAHLAPVQIDHKIASDEENVEVGQRHLRCIHTPGHTPGSMAVLLDTDHGRVIFAQDLHGPFYLELGSSLDRWAESMKKLLGLHPDVLCEGHYGVFRPRDKAEDFIRQHLRQHGFD